MYPSGDYKYDMQVMAEDLAEAEYGDAFYNLSKEKQHECFTRAMSGYYDRIADMADYLRDVEKEKGLR
jgi:hypothetical protein